jgi:hypothetical protein
MALSPRHDDQLRVNRFGPGQWFDFSSLGNQRPGPNLGHSFFGNPANCACMGGLFFSLSELGERVLCVRLDYLLVGPSIFETLDQSSTTSLFGKLFDISPLASLHIRLFSPLHYFTIILITCLFLSFILPSLLFIFFERTRYLLPPATPNRADLVPFANKNLKTTTRPAPRP